MSTHEQFAEDLALYALGTLPRGGCALLEEHLANCPACRRELEQLRGDGALLALSASGPRPPLRGRQRLMEALGKEARVAPAPVLLPAGRRQDTSVPHRSWWGFLGWAAAAAMLVFAASLWMENSALHEQAHAQQRKLSEQGSELQYQRSMVSALTAPNAMHVTLVAAQTPPRPEGKAFYLRERGSLVFMASNLPPLPAQKAYELWLIPASGAPMPAGVFKPDARGSATIMNPPLTAGTEAKAFAITIENEAGSSTPTMPIIMSGAGE